VSNVREFPFHALTPVTKSEKTDGRRGTEGGYLSEIVPPLPHYSTLVQ
jgi:hypothetical protein